MTGLSADLDLYVQQGTEPTLTAYECRPYNGGTSSESCTLPNSGETTWYISVYGFQAGSFDLMATLSAGGGSSVTELSSGQPVSDSAGYHLWKKYKITSSSSDTQLQVDMTGLSADLDLYVQQGTEPTLTAYECRPYNGNTSSESCTLSNSGETEWYISVYGFQAGSFDLEATLSGSSSVTMLTSGQQVSESVAYQNWANYKIAASSSDTQLLVDMTNLSADVDLYVKQGAMPTLSSYDCRPYRGGTTSESCTLTNSGSNDWYIAVYGYQAGSFDLKAVLSGGSQTGALLFPFTERNDIWQICQGYNTPNISHTGNLIYSFDFAYGTGNLGNTGCWGNPSGSEDMYVVAPGVGTIAWIGSTAPDITCLRLDDTVSNGHGSNVASIKLGHMKSDVDRVNAGQVDQGDIIGKLCGPTGCSTVGGYAHIHMSAYTSTDCSGTSVPLGTVFGNGYDFGSDGTLYQWHGTEIPAL
jgi:hypothetical protein